ncbi:efflux RND transporter periplasmic adaptor subunit [Prevotella copri]|uniref:Efflux RND transporter periplasmic adaptor subunit n=1 Tax=Segatella copri TaxID=165179 RepID=A0A6G1U441_9BACT|nr:efflux RND transporter periplasmic adaptor subunit [Segatella copri]MQN82196.1 efflux RND transporter periplasmic adaptor subunit [Segatella copri]
MKRVILIVAVTAIAWAGFAFFAKQTGSEAHAHEEHEHEEVDYDHIPLTAKQVSTVDLKMGEAVEREMDATIEAKGSLVLRAQAMGDVASLMGGIVKSIFVKEGQLVHRGQVVATVENTDVVSLQREYYSAAKECELAKADWERQLLLSKQGAGVKRTLQQTRKDYQVAHANLLGIGRQLAQMGISTSAVAKGKFTTAFPLRAPISGVVSQLTASLGSYADMQTPLMKIRNTQAVECDLNVFEKDLAKVKVGNRVTFSLTNQPGVKLSGTVYGMNQYFNDGSKSVAVHVKMDDASLKTSRINHIKLFDGMYVSGQIATGSQRCLALPSEAIVSTDGKQYVFALNGEPKKGEYSFSRHEVSTGVTDGGFTEVKLCDHLKAGKKIVTDNAFYLASLTGEHGEHAH